VLYFIAQGPRAHKTENFKLKYNKKTNITSHNNNSLSLLLHLDLIEFIDHNGLGSWTQEPIQITLRIFFFVSLSFFAILLKCAYLKSLKWWHL